MADPSTGGPAARYRERLSWWESQAGALDRRYNLVAAIRAALFVLLVVLAWIALTRNVVPLWWAGAPLAGFLVAAFHHERLHAARARARRGTSWYRRALARLEDNWAGTGDPGDRFRDADHLYADDLDLFGTGSLFELLATARTSAGQSTLAAWLMAPAAPAEVRARQAAVKELVERPGLLEDLALSGDQVAAAGEAGGVVAWGSMNRPPPPRWAGPVTLGASLANVVALAGAAWFGLPAAAALAVLGASLLLAVWLRRSVGGIVGEASRPSRELDLMATLIARLETERFAAPALTALRDRLADPDGTPASRRIRALYRLVALLDSRKNQLFIPIAALLLWTEQCALAIERWRQRSGPAIGRWISTLGEFEALAALATFAEEHPDYAWPELADGPASLHAAGLAHPLLPRVGTVANPVELGGVLRLLVVSGSNMSGKSTMLRAIGVNLVLAQCGAPVRATAMRLSPLAIGASFRPVDSLREGQSRFYAEITRIRRIVDLMGQDRPVLFLLDELLSGTNSHDRLIGARALVEHLVEGGAIGLITTHDLALAGIAEGLGDRAANVHFEDHLEDGRLVFDYRLRPGVVQRSNALDLMRSVGLRV